MLGKFFIFLYIKKKEREREIYTNISRIYKFCIYKYDRFNLTFYKNWKLLIFIVFVCFLSKKNLLKTKIDPDKWQKKYQFFFLLRTVLILTC